ncbi:hypothetical protein [Vibrio casei]|uniref:hypothetical protein n=1 Tax=Vibrio casei TaxID=673372 RepID=UPI003F9C4A4A
MAAEKLTKARLVQITLIFIVLVSAFTWRTIEHREEISTKISCKKEQICQFKDLETDYSILFNQVSSSELKITLQIIKNKMENKNQITKSIWLSSQGIKLERTHLSTSQELHLSIINLENKNAFIIETDTNKLITLILSN